jgi:hypothetical protein
MNSSDNPAEDKLRQVAEFIRTERQNDARLLLREVLIADRNNLLAWELLFHVAHNQEEKTYCLKAILSLRPDHPWAGQQLAEINRAAEVPTQVLAEADLSLLEKAPVQTQPASSGVTLEKPGKKKGPSRFLLVAAIVMVGLVCVGLAGFAIDRIGALYRTSPAGLTAAHDQTCQALIQQAVQASGSYCQQIGSNKVCYGNNILKADLSPSTSERFTQHGDVVDIGMLRSLSASPLVLDKHQWGIAVFKVLANLPNSLPGETVTLLVFGNTQLDNNNTSGSLQAFHFSSDFGQIVCNKVNLDGIMVTLPKGQGVHFMVNGTELTLVGNASLKAAKNGKMQVSLYSGAGEIVSQGQEQYFGAGQQVSVQLGGPGGSDAISPPSTPEPLSTDELNLACSMGGQYCSPSEITPVSPGEAQATVVAGLATSTSTPTLMTPTTTLPLTKTPIGTPTATYTSVVTGTNTPTPPSGTATPTHTSIPTTGTATPTRTLIPTTGTATPTRTPIPPTGTATPTRTPIPPTGTATPTHTPILSTDTPTPTHTPIPPTDTPIPPTNTPGCGQITLGTLNKSGHNLTLTITNNYGVPITITSLHVTWNRPIAQNLDTVNLNGTQIGNPMENTSPTWLPEHHSFVGPPSHRRISNGTTKTLMISFSHPPDGTGYTIQLIFDIGCPVSASR